MSEPAAREESGPTAQSPTPFHDIATELRALADRLEQQGDLHATGQMYVGEPPPDEPAPNPADVDNDEDQRVLSADQREQASTKQPREKPGGAPRAGGSASGA